MGLNELKLIMDVHRTLIYKNILSIVTKLLLDSCSKAPKSSDFIARSASSAMLVLALCRKLNIMLT